MLQAGVAAAAVAAGGALWWLETPQDSLRTITRLGRVRVGYAIESPFAFVDRSGRLAGEGPETARLAARLLQWETEFVQTRFDALISDLRDGRFDLVAASLFITPDRERLVRFARPELRVAAGLLLGKGADHEPGSYDELVRSSRLRTGVVAGTVEEAALQGIRGRGLVVVPDAHAGATAVETGLIDALAVSYPTARTLAAPRQALHAVRMSGKEGGSLVAAAFRPGDRRLAATWNVALGKVLGSDEHRQLLLALGFDPALDVPLLAANPGRQQ